MIRASKLGLALAGTLAVAACRTDVSRSTAFGTQGAVVAGLITAARGIAAGRDGVFSALADGIEFSPGDNVWQGFYYGTREARIVTDDQNVYWTELVEGTATGGRVLYCPQDGCGAGPVVVAEQLGVSYGTDVGQVDLGFLAVEGDLVYWTTTDPRTMTVSLDSCPFASCGAPTTVPLAAEMTPIAVHGGTLYAWSARVAGTAIVTCPATPALPGQLPCTEPATLIPESLGATQAAIDGSHLYFSGGTARRLSACTLPACGDITQIADQSVFVFTVRDGILYTNSLDPGFASCSLASCAGGPQALDLPFSPVVFPQTDPPPTIVAGVSGAYAYATYLPDPHVAAIVYLPLPGGAN